MPTFCGYKGINKIIPAKEYANEDLRISLGTEYRTARMGILD
jgi:hypothetical protein